MDRACSSVICKVEHETFIQWIVHLL